MNREQKKLFILDDDPMWTKSLNIYLQGHFNSNMKIFEFNDGESCMKSLAEKPHFMLIDYVIEFGAYKKNGIDYLKQIKASNPSTLVIIVSSTDAPWLYKSSITAGAHDLIIKGQQPITSLYNKIGKVLQKVMD